MQSPDETTQNTESIERISRPFNRREAVNEKRHNLLQQKQTDTLPQVQAETLNNRIAWRQLIQLREENKRLRWLLAEAGRDAGNIAGQSNQHQAQETEQYRERIGVLEAEQERLQEAYHQLEYRYQSLYHSFQSQVEEEAQRMVEDAARTIDFAPTSRTGSFKDVMKTVELHVRQVEDKHTAEALYLMRQAQHKAAKLEQELAKEREQITLERQNLHTLQASVREQAELRKRIVEDRLQLQYTVTMTVMTTFFLLLLPITQLVFFSLLHLPLTLQIAFALFAPLLICVVLVAIFSYIRSSTRLITSGTPQKKAVQNKDQDKKEEKKKTA
jgi:hypothetical protein